MDTDGINAATPNRNGGEEEATTESRASPRSRKHGRENAANGLGLDIPTSAPSAKRIRRNNHERESSGNGNGHSNSMEIDQNGDTDARPEPISRSHSPGAEEETRMDMDAYDDAPAPEEACIGMPVTNGPSVGVQSDKVAELGTETTVLTLPAGKHVTHTAWNPQDPSLLAIAGDALCRIWVVAKTSPEDEDSPTSHRHVDMLDSFEGSLVSTMEWSPSGETLALATRRGPSLCVGLVSLWTKHGKSIEELPSTEDMVLTFRWSPTGEHLLGITNSGAGTSTIIIWHLQDSEFKSEYRVAGIVRDAAWTGDMEFMICGHDLIEEYTFDGQAIYGKRALPTHPPRNWSHIRFDTITRITAMVAEDDGTLAVLDDSGKIRVARVHTAEITALAFQPIPNPASYSPSSPRLLATSALDCSIKLWDAQRPFDLVTSLSLGSSNPPMAISFTADGYLVTAANGNRVVIWNPEKGGVPLATWKGELSQWQGSAMNGLDHDSGIGEEEEIPPHSLSWDAHGGKLAFGLRNQVCPLTSV